MVYATTGEEVAHGHLGEHDQPLPPHLGLVDRSLAPSPPARMIPHCDREFIADSPRSGRPEPSGSVPSARDTEPCSRRVGRHCR